MLETIWRRDWAFPWRMSSIDLARIQNGKLVEVFVSGGGDGQVAEPALLGAFQVAVRDDAKGWVLVEPRDQQPVRQP
jgi:hypothetical protein